MKTLLLPLLALVPLAAHADPRAETSRRDEPRVTVYQNTDFRGASRTFHAGETVDNFANLGFNEGGLINDRISSIRLEGDAEVLEFKQRHAPEWYRRPAPARIRPKTGLAGTGRGATVSRRWEPAFSRRRI